MNKIRLINQKVVEASAAGGSCGGSNQMRGVILISPPVDIVITHDGKNKITARVEAEKIQARFIDCLPSGVILLLIYYTKIWSCYNVLTDKSWIWVSVVVITVVTPLDTKSHHLWAQFVKIDYDKLVGSYYQSRSIRFYYVIKALGGVVCQYICNRGAFGPLIWWFFTTNSIEASLRYHLNQYIPQNDVSQNR